MELWIRSQDKTRLSKVHDIKYVEKESDFNDYENVIRIYCGDFNIRAGAYKTKERALEVLDEIQKLIKPTFKINYEYDDSQPIIDGEWLKSLKAESKIEELSCYVYEMPKE